MSLEGFKSTRYCVNLIDDYVKGNFSLEEFIEKYITAFEGISELYTDNKIYNLLSSLHNELTLFRNSVNYSNAYIDNYIDYIATELD